jgi:arginyl-tRNA synthetase
VVRARNIFRKAGTTPEAALQGVNAADYFEGEAAAGLWELWIMASRLSLLLEQCIAAAEPAYLAKHAFQLAQLFNNFYHRHHILTEEDPGRRQFLLATAAVAERALVRCLDWLGVAALIPLKEAVRCDERNLLSKGSRNQHAVEGIAMMVRQAE